MPEVGFLSSASSGPYTPFVVAFRQGLNEAGYVSGKPSTASSNSRAILG